MISQGLAKGVSTDSRWGTGRIRMRWAHESGFVEIGITENATKEPDFWLRLDVKDAGEAYYALQTAIACASPLAATQTGSAEK